MLCEQAHVYCLYSWSVFSQKQNKTVGRECNATGLESLTQVLEIMTGGGGGVAEVEEDPIFQNNCNFKLLVDGGREYLDCF